MKNIIFSICLIVFFGINLSAVPVLPPDGFVEGWQKDASPQRFEKNDLYGHINGGAELFLEFGFEELLVQRYVNGKEEIDLELYLMDSPEAALGIYLMKCGRETPVEGLSDRNTGDNFQFTIVKGNYFVQVNSFTGEATLLPTMVALARQTLATISENDTVTILENLPKENLVIGSERIVRGPYSLQPIFTFGQGDVLQMKGKIFGVTANYKDAYDSVYSLINILYPDLKSSRKAFDNFVINHDTYLKVIKQSDKKMIFQDYRERFGSAEIKESILEFKVNLINKPACDTK